MNISLIYELKNKFEKALTECISDLGYGISKVSFVGDCIKIEYLDIEHGDMCIKSLIIDKNNNII